MRICTVRMPHGMDVGIATGSRIVLLGEINRIMGTKLGPTLLEIIACEQADTIRAALSDPAILHTSIPASAIVFQPIYRNPPKLWGVGLNYRRHADDLQVEQPKGAPGSYLRASSTIIGYGDDILLPAQSDRVTAEAELGVVIGRTCKDVMRRMRPRWFLDSRQFSI